MWKNFVVLELSLEWYEASRKLVAYKSSFRPRSADEPAGSHQTSCEKPQDAACKEYLCQKGLI